MGKLESKFQTELKKEIEAMLPGAIVMKNDPTYIQGIPDLTILYGKRWAALECKKSAHESFRPNQKYYIRKLDEMSFARAIYPENKQEVLDELQKALRPTRVTRLPRCEQLALDQLQSRQAR